MTTRRLEEPTVSEGRPEPSAPEASTSPPMGGGRSSNRRLAAASLGALGVVFGDLGTSPLYALHDTFVGNHAMPTNRTNVLGVMSLFLWSLVIVVSLKYLIVMMRADNKGEGGIFALLALTGATRLTGVSAGKRRRTTRFLPLILVLGIAGAALLYGDGVITPAISVLSAVEGLTVATSIFQPYIVPITVVVLVVLFAVQSLGSGRIGKVFGPVLALWFVAISLIGVRAIAKDPSVLVAIDPLRGVRFFQENGWHGFPVLGAVVLCLTGGEALYADMGHFGRRPIRLAWFALVFPSLILSYLGQAAILLIDPAAAENPFFRSAPTWSLYPLVILATAATVIASQGLISAVFSMTRQAVQLGLSPRMRIMHTSSEEIGQIYIPTLNWVLMAACLSLVLGFQSSTRLAAAFGLAVSGTMAITTLLLVAVAAGRWHWGTARIAAVAGVFLIIDLAFLGANLLKIVDGGWIPLVIGGVVLLLFTTWRKGTSLLQAAAEEQAGTATDAATVLASIAHGAVVRVSGTAIYMHRVTEGVPRTLLHNLKHNKVLHQRTIFLTVETEEVPYLTDAERVEVKDLNDGFWRISARYGFMEEPNVPRLLELAQSRGLPFRPAETSYFFGRETVIPSEKPGMALWRERLFALMTQNARPAPLHFGLTPNRVVELGALVEI